LPDVRKRTRECAAVFKPLLEGQPIRQRLRITPDMSISELRALLDEVPDTRELILRDGALGASWDAAYAVWSDAHVDAEDALAHWRRDRGREAYAAYRAAQDREDAAQDALAVVPVG
jgi:hypothetical protein